MELRSLGKDYINLLRSCPLYSHVRDGPIPDDPRDLDSLIKGTAKEIAESRTILVRTPYGAAPAWAAAIAELLQNVAMFWEDQFPKAVNALRASAGHSIILRTSPDLTVLAHAFKEHALFFRHGILRDPLLDIYRWLSVPSMSPVDQVTLLHRALAKFVALVTHRRFISPEAGRPWLIILPQLIDAAPEMEHANYARARTHALRLASELAGIDVTDQTDFAKLIASRSVGILEAGGRFAELYGLPPQTLLTNYIEDLKRRGQLSKQSGEGNSTFLLHIMTDKIAGLGTHAVQGSLSCQDGMIEPGRWNLYQWVLKAEGTEFAAPTSDAGQLLSFALQSADLAWLERVPLSTIRRLSEDDPANRLRSVFEATRSSMRVDDWSAVAKVAAEAAGVMNDEIDRFAATVDRKRRAAKSDLVRRASWTGASAGISVVGALVGPVGWVWSAIGVIVGSPSLRDIVKGHKNSKAEIREMCSRPIGILYSARAESDTRN